jgi:hypothetical protein
MDLQHFGNANRLDLTMEAYVLKPGCQGLFTQDEIAIARKRLSDLGYKENVDEYRKSHISRTSELVTANGPSPF